MLVKGNTICQKDIFPLRASYIYIVSLNVSNVNIYSGKHIKQIWMSIWSTLDTCISTMLIGMKSCKNIELSYECVFFYKIQLMVCMDV